MIGQLYFQNLAIISFRMLKHAQYKSVAAQMRIIQRIEITTVRIFLILLKITRVYVTDGSQVAMISRGNFQTQERCGCRLSYFTRFQRDGKSCVIRASLARKNLDLAYLDGRCMIRAGASRRISPPRKIVDPIGGKKDPSRELRAIRAFS